MPAAASWLLVLVLVLALPALALPRLAVADDLTPEKRTDIRRLIGVEGGAKLSGQLAAETGRAIEASLKKTRPGIPDRVFATLNRDLIAYFEAHVDVHGGLLDRIVAVYARHFTHPEIKELLVFNETPIGRKTMQVMPALMNESRAAGQAWGRELAPEVQRRVNAVLTKEGVQAPAKK